MGELLHGDETRVCGDKTYDGQRQVISEAAPAAQDHTHDRGHHQRPLSERQKAANHAKSRVRAKVEHPIGTIKRVFGFRRVRYRGIAKNTNRLFVASGLANLFMMRRRLLLASAFDHEMR